MKTAYQLISIIIISGAIGLSAISCRRAVPRPRLSQTPIAALIATPAFTAPSNPYPIEDQPTAKPQIPYPGPGNADEFQPMISRTPPPTELPRNVIFIERLECTAEADYARGDDRTLGVEFEYPALWGDIETTLRRGDTGLVYTYHFGNLAPEQMYVLEAGGISRDFTEGRGGMITDFSGFGDKTGCARYDWGSICEEINQNVIFVLIFPNADSICDPGPTVYYSPIAIVAIDLPQNPTIHGFVFVSPFLSEELDTELHSLLGITPEGGVTKCDPESKQQFTSKVSELVEGIKDGSLDAVTMNNIDQIRHLANSIELK